MAIPLGTLVSAVPALISAASALVDSAAKIRARKPTEPDEEPPTEMPEETQMGDLYRQLDQQKELILGQSQLLEQLAEQNGQMAQALTEHRRWLKRLGWLSVSTLALAASAFVYLYSVIPQ